MPFDPVAVAGLFAAAGILLVLPGAWYVRRLHPHLTLLEAAAAGYGLAVAAGVVAMALWDLALAGDLGFGTVAVGYAALVALPASAAAGRLADGLWGWADLAGPRTDPRRLAGLTGLGLLVLTLAALWAGHSNIVRLYPYPHHADGYIHWGNARAVLDHGGLPYGDWLTGGGSQKPTDETGFWYLLAGLAWLTPLSLAQVAIHGKLLFGAALAVAAWAYGSQDGTPFGLEAALLAPLIPTTHRFLGPMFLVPMTVVLTMALSAGILARARPRRRSVPLLLLLGAGGLLVHSATAGVLALVAGWRLLLTVTSRRRAAAAAGATAAFAAGFLLVVTGVPHLHALWDRMIQAWTQPQSLSQHGLSGGGAAYLGDHLGGFATLLFGLGIVAAFRGRRPDAQALVLSLPPILAIMIAYERWTRGFSSLYDRTFFFTGFLFLMIAGVGLAEARRIAVVAARRRHGWRTDPVLGPLLGPLVAEISSWLPSGDLRHVRRRVRDRLDELPDRVPDAPLRRARDGVPEGALVAARRGAQGLAPAAALVLAGGVGPVVTAAGTVGVYAAVDPLKRDTYYNTHPENETFQRLFWIRDHLGQLDGVSLALLDPSHANELAAVTGLHVWSHSSHPHVRAGQAPAVQDFLDARCRPLDYLNRSGADLVVGPCQAHEGLLERVHEEVYVYAPALEDGRDAGNG